ncbi:hypothetical protein Hanom_Chr03g00236551 [Helianthus anomalus]
MYVILAITIIFFGNNFVSMKLVYSIGSRWQNIGRASTSTVIRFLTDGKEEEN